MGHDGARRSSRRALGSESPADQLQSRGACRLLVPAGRRQDRPPERHHPARHLLHVLGDEESLPVNHRDQGEGGDSRALSIKSAFMATAAPVLVVKTTIDTTSFSPLPPQGFATAAVVEATGIETSGDVGP